MNQSNPIARATFKVCLTTLIVLLLSSQSLHSEEKVNDDKFDLNLTLNSDAFFGFYPFFAGSYELNDNIDFTFYGILWSGGTGENWGNWTEFGAGIGFNITESIYVNPQIGILNGSLTSGLGNTVLGEGIVPNLTVLVENGRTEGEIYAGYYYGFDHGNPVTNNYLHWWLSGGYDLGKIISIGAHFEHLRFTGGQNQPSNSAYDYYMAVGPYIKISSPNGGSFVKFIAASDLRPDDEIAKSGLNQPSFFKLIVGFGI
ncbi:hypothetical protein OAQ99_00350 [Candidatus Kapabacteria bacterium]|nr:hypothetical protein [Candidatus Kapabacteria bacterium]